MKAIISRRALLERIGVVAGALATTRVASLAAAEQPHLSPSDPAAAALGYSEEATQIDVSGLPSYRPGQKCANCMQNMGVPGQTWGSCTLFLGKLVNTNGWCRGYVKTG